MAKRPLIIGITGGIGSGKSTVCKIFESLGIPVYDADSRAKWVMNHNSNLKAQIVDAFGEDSYTTEGLNRPYLAKLVFADQEKTDKLNSFVHPAVGKDFQDWADGQAKKKFPYLIKEAALLIESGSFKQLDELILVTAPEEIRIKRVLQRDSHRTEKDVRDVIERQMPEDEKRKYCGLVLENDGSKPILATVLKFHSSMLGNS